MILFELVGNEAHPVYQELAISNGNRQYDFLQSVVVASLGVGRPFLSQTVLKALNFQAITCLHTNAGEYRPCPVVVGDYHPPAHYQVPALMDDMVNSVNRNWETTDPVALASYVLWRLNHIHPFINGNGRTARAASYFVLCLRAGGWLPGNTILPELLVQRRDDYVIALREADRLFREGRPHLAAIHALVSELLEQQLATSQEVEAEPGEPDAS